MKSRFWIFIAAIVGIIILSNLVPLPNNGEFDLNGDGVIDENVATSLTIWKSGQGCIKNLGKGGWYQPAKYRVGDTIKFFKRLKGQNAHFISDKRTLIAVLDEKSLGAQCTKIIQWNSEYGDRINISVVNNTIFSDNFLASKGVKNFIESQDFRRINPYWYLVNEDGKIVYQFRPYIWKNRELDEMVKKFATTNSFAEVTQLKSIQLGQFLRLPQWKDALGKTFALKDFRGKPTMLFFVNPSYGTSEEIYQSMRNFKTRHKDKINLALIIDYSYNPENIKSVDDFEKHVSIFKWKFSSIDKLFTLEDLFTIANLRDVPIFLDNRRVMFDYFLEDNGFFIIVDKQGRLRQIYNFGELAGGRNIYWENDVERDMKKLF